MASKEYVLKLKWENDDSFKLTTQLDGGTTFTVIEMDENATIHLVWPYADKICRAYFNKIITEIGTEMKT